VSAEPKGTELFECLRRALAQQWLHSDSPDRLEEVTVTIQRPSDKEMILTASLRMVEL
jgi:hypothetical protein